MRLRERPKRDYTVDITPLVDIVFLMLIFFMVSTSFKVASSLKLELPTSKSQEQVSEKQEVIVSVSPSGQFYVQDEAVSDLDLRKRILNETKGDPNMRVVLRADAKTQHRYVVRALDVLRGLGMGKVAIATVNDKENP
ncbi:MAG: biopolymer transporter ExbD [Zetaproteobacteria bacterium CG06_land_8_20_14_3_00_59_53]|nr:MAG: biopolymer transporter ExbD [Zetaproteobacteria bacterium CG2_30_59_37]PIO90052.1 MAG: biopolymer transporter ExbD [Zetaproteobacteria bacterium CG23_combo_of_CG06-09_8_20_14_all_59_86]PIQ64976.1 MAG: biopolymer transporter ExbD [Zetaproteobacteria bacterium CG11_big_fil_rev_8_21_14_0_20_59_439]PIU69454.1 MAG: biopolymer transporter ExbD [Zetaproteobacteria bacterium CG06_land_8_20_14_3_00_59_53]PIU96794.1 MAG: biopolymer transporter ExbD [Zetaproteobacteria bacterium CG03_land_8_20_14_